MLQSFWFALIVGVSYIILIRLRPILSMKLE